MIQGLVITCRDYDSRKLLCGILDGFEQPVSWVLKGRGKTRTLEIMVYSKNWIDALSSMVELVEKVSPLTDGSMEKRTSRILKGRPFRAIKLPLEVSPKVELEVVKALVKNIHHIDLSTRKKVRKTFTRMVVRLGKSGDQWKIKLAHAAQNLFFLLNEDELDFEIPEIGPLSRRAIWATLLYLCEVDDVIPDHIPGVGYTDDAYAVNHCYGVLRREDKTAFDWVCKRIGEQ
ncbi:MAG: DUF1232 domain-containing protein [Bacteroidetes Order II. Incertae sedis bacterium]|jgi:uncharacterized membrane protein YkvA (DUF1232 family)|nr:DUF1232 domain-containing protein [Bacteroidetes Order II. bacterium]